MERPYKILLVKMWFIKSEKRCKSPTIFEKLALHNCGMILQERIDYHPRVSVSPCPRVGLNHPSIQQRRKISGVRILVVCRRGATSLEYPPSYALRADR